MIVGAVILFVISAAALVMSVLSFMEKGFLFNNAHIYASKQERKEMNKKPHYRQSAIVFLLIGLIFFLNGLDLLLNTSWIFYAVIGIVLSAVLFAIISGIAIAKRGEKK